MGRRLRKKVTCFYNLRYDHVEINTMKNDNGVSFYITIDVKTERVNCHSEFLQVQRFCQGVVAGLHVTNKSIVKLTRKWHVN